MDKVKLQQAKAWTEKELAVCADFWLRSVTNMSWLTRSPASSLVLPGRRQAERFSSLRPPWLPEKATLSSPASWAM